MLTIATSKISEADKIKISLKSKNIFDELCAVISEYDPEFIFLPAYLVAKRVNERIENGASRKDAIKEICSEFKIKNSNRSKKILKVAERILNNSST